MNEIDRILERYNAAKTRKSRSDSERQEAGQYVWPQAQDQVRNAESKDTIHSTVTLYDSTAMMASYRMTSGIFTYLMPVGARWFEFVAQDYNLNQDPNYQQWMSIATAQTHKEIWRSNFQREMFITIRSMIVFGTGIISVEKIGEDIVFKSHHVGYMFFDDNNRGEIDTAYRQIFYTVRQAAQEFGEENLSKTVKKALAAGKLEEKHEYVHVCGPNKDFDSSKAGSHRVKSLYICIPDKAIVKEGGFKHLPYLVARFERAPGSIMGIGPAIEMLPEIKMLNRMKKTFILASEIAALPPLVVEDDGVVGQPVTGPMGMIYMRAGAMEPKALQTGINAQLNAEVIAQQQEIVKEAFFNDLFMALAQHKNMTATEVVERVEEKIAILAPAIVSLQKEIFSPLITRVLDLLKDSSDENRRIPEPPESFDYDVVYQGRLALAMSNMQTNAIEATLSKWAPYAEVSPVFDNVNWDLSFRTSWLNAGAPAEGLKDMKQMKEEREQSNQLQIAAAQAEIADSASKAYRNVLSAPEQGSLAEAI